MVTIASYSQEKGETFTLAPLPGATSDAPDAFPRAQTVPFCRPNRLLLSTRRFGGISMSGLTDDETHMSTVDVEDGWPPAYGPS
jgi:hypothetical protein